MEHTKKMILIDPRILESFQKLTTGPLVADAMSDSLREMDHRMRDVLDRTDMNFEDKTNAYQQALWRYLKRVEQYKNKPLGTVTVRDVNSPQPTPNQKAESGLSMTSPPLENVGKDVVQSVPKTMKNKAERLLQRIQNHPDLKWNQHGEIVWRGQLIKNSNLIDLVNDVLRKRRNVQPIGWKPFAAALSDINVPRDLVGNPERWNFMRTQILGTPSKSTQPTERLDDITSSPPTFSTPQIPTPPPLPKNVALSSIKKRKATEEEEQSKGDTPFAWRIKTHKRKRKEQRLSKTTPLLDWEMF